MSAGALFGDKPSEHLLFDCLTEYPTMLLMHSAQSTKQEPTLLFSPLFYPKRINVRQVSHVKKD